MSVATSPAFRFNGKNVGAQRVAERHGARLVTRITEETRAALRALIHRSIREGIPPYDAARTIRSMVGMNAPQAQAAFNYRRDLIDSGLSLHRVDTLTERYVEKKVRERSETIARTEIMGALNEGQREAFRQAKAGGLLGEGATKEWITTPDERLCPECEPMDGVRVPLEAPFPIPGPPAHPNCRCAVAVVP